VKCYETSVQIGRMLQSGLDSAPLLARFNVDEFQKRLWYYGRQANHGESDPGFE